jgi:hypothetical protein
VRRLSCPVCGARVFFDDVTCVRCGTRLAFDPAADAITDAAAGLCRHSRTWNCNWVHLPGTYQCVACSLDRHVSSAGPDLTTFQSAKRRVIRQLILLGIDPATTSPPLRFELLRSTPSEQVTTGQADGLVTLDIAEGRPSQLEQVRTSLAEAYRAPVGHVRHESGHWHWQASVAVDEERLAAFRELFGDERLDYPMALERHYQRIDDGSWREVYLSFYAKAHPWEDYAESFAHVLHMLAMLETAQAEGFIGGNPDSFDEIYRTWAPLTVSLNEMARSMGTAEPYPFAPPAQAVRKMAFVYGLLAPAPAAPSS